MTRNLQDFMPTLPLQLLGANERTLVARHERSQEPSLFKSPQRRAGPPQVEPLEAERLTTG